MNKILVITQCFPCGSWLCIEKIVEKISQSGCRVHILGLGKPSEKIRGIRYHLIPYFAYTRFGNITCASPALGFLWYLPLYLAALSAALFLNPKAIIYNGLTSGLILSPFFKLFGKKNIIMYHSVIGYTSGVKRSILRFLFRFVDFTVVNSIGSRDDLSSVVSGDLLRVFCRTASLKRVTDLSFGNAYRLRLFSLALILLAGSRKTPFPCPILNPRNSKPCLMFTMRVFFALRVTPSF